MTTVFRVKRRIDEDPAEALRLCCKKQRRFDSKTEASEAATSAESERDNSQSDIPSKKEVDISPIINKDPCISKITRQASPESCTSFDKSLVNQEIQSVLSFAGTISSKDEPVSKHVKAAIRKKKLHRNMHPHSADGVQGEFHRERVSEKLRDEASTSSRSNRYKVTCSRRAVDLDLLDEEVSGSEGISLITTGEKTEPIQFRVEIEEEKGLSPQTVVAMKENGDQLMSDRNIANKDILHSDIIKEDKMFCMFDVENEADNVIKKESSSCGITMNGQPMVSTQVKAPLAESEYVYDLYYTHSNLSNLDLEAVLTVQTLCDQFVTEAGDGADRELVYEDEDDSNDEGNWRNDYPDEDPHFFENGDDEDAECYYTEDMNYKNIVDDGDMLAQYMKSRCRVGDDSDADEEDYGEGSDSNSDLDGI